MRHPRAFSSSTSNTCVLFQCVLRCQSSLSPLHADDVNRVWFICCVTPSVIITDPIYRQVPTGRAKGRPHSNKRRPGSVSIGLFVRPKSRRSDRDLLFAIFHTAQLFKFKTDQANDMKLIEKLNKIFCCIMSAPQPSVDLLIGLVLHKICL